MPDLLSRAEADQRVQAGIVALQRRDLAGARREAELASTCADPPIEAWLLLGIATNLQADYPAAEAAADRVLAVDPANQRAMVIKGDARAQAGDPRAARSFYEAVLASAATQRPTPDIERDLPRLSAYCQQAAAEYRAYLEAAIAKAGVTRSPRFAQSIDLLFGEKQIYLQEPTVFYFPGLPQIQFYEREDFDWLAEVEAATDDIRKELGGLLETEAGFNPYVVDEKNRAHGNFHGLNNNPNWSALHLYDQGRPIPENIARAPKTFAAMQAAPLCHCARRTPAVMFSLLRARTKIPAHNGMLNTRLICHLPLIVPPGCGFRVGNEVREWEVGKTLIFDDSIEHEAWNDSVENRVVLLFDIWRPELSLDERAAVTAIFEAIDDYGAEPAIS